MQRYCKWTIWNGNISISSKSQKASHKHMKILLFRSFHKTSKQTVLWCWPEHETFLHYSGLPENFSLNIPCNSNEHLRFTSKTHQYYHFLPISSSSCRVQLCFVVCSPHFFDTSFFCYFNSFMGIFCQSSCCMIGTEAWWYEHRQQ